MPAVPSGSTVAVTGASGYIGSHFVQELLNRGFKVHAIVRNENDESKTGHLRKMAEKLPAGSLKFFNGDLFVPNSFDSAFAGVDGVIHTAAVVEVNKVKDPQKTIVDPSVVGTNNVLASVDKAESIKRMVHTSSVAAVHAVDKPSGTMFSEEDWNTYSTLDGKAGDPYGLAKTTAEKLVMEHFATVNRSCDFAIMNPSVTLGPCLTKHHTKASAVVVRQLLFGNVQPNYHGHFVDVRDVAKAHVEALIRPEASGCRFILSLPGGTWVVRLEDDLRRLFPQYKIEGKTYNSYALGLIWYLSYLPIVGPSLLNNFQASMITKEFHYDNTKARTVLGIDFTPLDKVLADTVNSMVDSGFLVPRLIEKK